MGSFAAALRALGLRSYDEYLRSPHWRAFRAAYHRTHAPVTCAACPRTTVSLHHVTYARLGRERPADVIPLCRGHHEAVHRWLDANGLPVENTAQALAHLTRPGGRGRRRR